MLCSQCSPTRTQMALSSVITLVWWQGNIAEKRDRVWTPYISSSDLQWRKVNEAAFMYKLHTMNQSPKVLTCLTALAAPNLNWIAPMTLVSQLSPETAKLPEIMWSRSTMAPVIMLDHSELGNWSTFIEVSMDDLVNLHRFWGDSMFSWSLHSGPDKLSQTD